jgi:hypothetical protein
VYSKPNINVWAGAEGQAEDLAEGKCIL